MTCVLRHMWRHFYRYTDFTSLYPWCHKMTRTSSRLCIITENFDEISTYCGLINCKVLPPRELFHPVLPCHTQGKLSFPVPIHVIRTLLPILTVKQPFREHGVAWSWRKPWKKVTKLYKFIRIKIGRKSLEYTRYKCSSQWSQSRGAFSDWILLKMHICPRKATVPTGNDEPASQNVDSLSFDVSFTLFILNMIVEHAWLSV